ncbi:MAG: hypothetical protein GX443_06320 [Deltaproteobacteria bacterium]|nr:hypothetical protein [Deltaproteobacteria bacterium]
MAWTETNLHTMERISMEMELRTAVFNIGDDRIVHYPLPPDRAVVAAYEQYEKGNWEADQYPDPSEHPAFGVYKRGVACGDWIAYTESAMMSSE